MDEYMLYASTAETCGVPYEWLTPDQIKDRWPLIRTEDLKGAIYHRPTAILTPLTSPWRWPRAPVSAASTIERKWQAMVSLDRRPLGRDLHQDGRKGRQSGALATSRSLSLPNMWSPPRQPRAAHRAMLGIKIPAIPVEHTFIVMDQDPALVESREVNGPSIRLCATPTRNPTCAKNAAAGFWGFMKKARRHGLNMACLTVSAPTCSRSIWSGSKASTWR